MFDTINPKPIKRYKSKFFSFVMWIDLIFIFIGLIIATFIFVYGSSLVSKLITSLILLLVDVTLIIPIGRNGEKTYIMLYRSIGYLFSKKHHSKDASKTLISYEISKYDTIKTKDSEFIVFKINGLNFLTIGESDQHVLLEHYRDAIRALKLDYSICSMDMQQDLSKQVNIIKKQKKSKLRKISLSNINKIKKTGSDNEREHFLIIYGSKPQLLEEENIIISSFKYAELELVKLTKKHLSIFLKNFFNSNNNDVKQLINTDIIFKSKTFEMNNKFFKVINIDEWNSSSNLGWLYSITQIPNSIFIMNVENFLRGKAVKKIDKAIRDIEVQQLSIKKYSEGSYAEKEFELMSQLADDIQQDNEVVTSTHSFLLLEGNTKEELKENWKNVKHILSTNGVKPNELYFLQFEGFGALIPKRHSEIKKITSIELPSSSLANAFPYHQDNLYDENGIYMGFSKSDSNIFFDQWKVSSTRKNHNMVILGNSGGGKSTLLKKIVKDNALLNNKIFILDPQKENVKLCKNISGNRLEFGFSNSSKLIINPLEFLESDKNINLIAKQLQFLEGFFRTLFPNIKDSEFFELKQIIINLWNDFDSVNTSDYPIFSDLYKCILKELSLVKNDKNQYYRVENIYNLSLMFDCFKNNDSPESQLWNGKTNFDLKNSDIYLFDIYELMVISNKRIVNAQMHLILKFIMNQISNHRDMVMTENLKQNILIVIDEAHLLIDEKHPAGVDFLYTLVKTIRKFNGGVVITTQNISDLLGSSRTMRSKTSAILNNAQYSFYFQMNSDDLSTLNNLSDSVKFTKDEIDYISTCKKGEALFTLTPKDRKMIYIDLSEKELNLWKEKNEA